MKRGLIFISFFSFLINAFSQENQSFTIGFYNVENLFDTVHDYGKDDYEYLPESAKGWNTPRYNLKLQHTARVLLAMDNWKGADIVGLCEVENFKVLKDLRDKTFLSEFNYGIIHEESNDKRGIDVALLYKKSKFSILSTISHRVNLEARQTRDILHVKGIANKKDTIHVFVNHWPSRWGGKAKSSQKRIKAAKTLRNVIDSLKRAEKNPKIIIMGDFNDACTDRSIETILTAIADTNSFLYNTATDIEGTHKYKEQWSTFDQIMVSKALIQNRMLTDLKMQVFKTDWLIEIDELYGGTHPYRTWRGDNYLGGYSDHLAVYIRLNTK